MTRRLPVAVLALFLLLLPVGALADTASSLAADSSEDREYSEDEDGHAEEGGDDAEEHGGELTNMDNGDPRDAGAQALAGSDASGMATVLMVVFGMLVLVLLVGGLVMGNGKKA